MKSRKTILLISLVTLIGIAVPLYFAHAQDSLVAKVAGAGVGFLLDNVASNAIFKVAGWVVQLINAFVGMFLLPVAASLLAWVFTAGEFTRSEVVQAGWGITRDLANMGFILVLLIIGFATILRYQEGTYGVKALLPKLILAALLINFSLVIAGVFIDVGNDLALFFISGGEARAGDVVRVDGSLINAMRAQSILKFDESALAAELAKESEPQVKIIVRSLAQLAITLIITFLFFAMALLLVFRMIYLWILLILAPFAWLALAVPKSGYWNKWWNEFIKWSLVPAVIGFFVYIAVLAGRAAVGFGGTYVEGLQGSQTLPFEVFYELLSFIAVVMILGYGITVAPAWAGEGAVKAMSWAGKARDWSLGKVGGYAGRKGLQIGGGLAERALYGKDEKGARTKPRWLTQQLARSRITGVQHALRPAAALIQARADNIKKQEKELAKLDPRLLQARWNTLDADGKVAAARALAGKSLLQPGDIVGKEAIAATMKRAAAVGLEKELLIAAPDIAKEFNVINNSAEQTAERIRKIFERIKPEEWVKMNGSAVDVAEAKSPEEAGARKFVRELMLEGFAEGGGLHGGHLTNAAYKNMALYQSMTGVMRAESVEETVEEPHPEGLIDAMGRPVMVTRKIARPGQKLKDSVKKIVFEGVPSVLTAETAPAEAEEAPKEKETKT